MLALLLFLFQFESQAQRAVLKTVAYNLEAPNFACVLYVCSNACAYIVIAYAYNAQRLAGIGRQLAQVNPGRYILAGNELYCHWQLLRDYIIYLLLNCCNLFLGGRAGQGVVAFALLALNVCVAAALAPEHTNHGLVKYVFYSMHRCD